ncbi:16S rRNA (adenine(1518)-N(6)/adenine(1519)-N(6))-dimethyltransferase RsmA [Acaryochloris marina]|uniref:Ribosomal RNA small subunit methyltransferase A n=1 Tax=Acaryochloris marina (strain MBIC 11017) TaxID=329726 RepID=RSMA_ACAM1|nr:16S rRNA (adenine(1518)-N(6)/adenine(1519)-N(6))-dimethyltransferase RsmA [Acaryochloris marina]B0CC89.1 RecName: Full=Ribosomal RNA small subunit methyltransferase A; AltName: Full=16S rRNA (adenine(1518)-N(6)/adenine(1519)-N(6))-dimethyltransferase; AltName: Full=16S rRNA dimethyladenosine transferase; AltName: Full=16S rRNA dimethylase; AltName: Full=S-adenosylmethionine-6-N', N'-adenosyl(rRNA) dimethyltransferase [Acaryochloris marina MBIC11017]ABW26774.1 dimethyladenosine transferase [Aca
MPRPRKRFAQHWLKSQAVLRQIIAAAKIQGCDRILEIGPGRGVLTRELLAQAQSVVSVELDRDLCKSLRHTFNDQENFTLLELDFLNLDVAAELTEPLPNKVVANIPYNITSPILSKLLGRIDAPAQPVYETVVLLIQKEVADRLVAEPGSKIFNGLSVRSQYLADCELICPVPASAFKPAPKVESAVVRLTPRPYPQPVQNPQWLSTLLKVGFSSRRKMLRNNLKSLVDRDQLSECLNTLNISLQARAEDLSVTQWIALSDSVHPSQV